MRCFVRWRYLCVIFLFAARFAGAESGLEVLPDFRLGKETQMPCPLAGAGMELLRQDYLEDGAVEWQVSLQAPPTGDSPLYQDLSSADFVVQFPVSESQPTLHWSKGSHGEATDFQPRTDALSLGHPVVLESFGGRSSDGVMPYFNLATETGGLIVSVGWSGDWKALFETLPGSRVKVRAGLKRSRFQLSAGERVRLPSILVMSYQGDWIVGQNRFRQLMLKHFTPKNHSPLDLMPVAASVHGMIGFNATTEENLASLATDIAALKLPLNTFWLDAGWNEGGFPAAQGNPQADPVRFPRGLSPVGQAVGQTGMRFLTWFEPERAMRGTWLDREHPGWLLTPRGTPNELRYMEKDGFLLLDLGNAEARQWALDTVSRQIQEAGIAIYRQDFNEYPSYFWRSDDSAEEMGLREVRYINGLYDFLDRLSKRHPKLIIDNCASGGRRYDYEMMRRSVCLWRSDSCWDDKSFPRNVQGMTHGLSHWIPLHGLGSLTTDDIALRSGMGACASFAANYRDPLAVANLRQHLERYLPVRQLFMKDFYPLTEWNVDSTQWLAFQYHDPVTGEGLVQAFCGANSPKSTHRLHLRGLIPETQYTFRDWDSLASPISRSGADVSHLGIEVQATGTGTAKVLHYTPVR